ncbi:endolytic transglycosylase MltG [Paenibacillus tarimensis]
MDKPIRKSRITIWVVLSLLGVVFITAAGIALYIWNGLRPTAEGELVRIEIAKGTTPFKVAEQLEEEGIIRNAFIFKYYLRFNNEGSRFQAGVYDMHPGMEHEEIIAKLNSGDTVKAETVRFTIPEGYTVLQIADKLSAEGLVDKQKFLELAESEAMFAYSEAASQVQAKDEMHHVLEGYLFPETYEMKKDSTEQDIIIRMLQELDRKLNQLPEGWGDALEERELTFHEVMVIASLVEREVVVDEERPIVAGIIYNRLKLGMPLQIDATVQYLLDKPKERLLEKDLQVESPYNTYKVNGLPPGPIANPSLASIEAALFPEETEYLFYVTKKDGSQKHLFAKTYNEHLNNINKSKQTEKN